MPTSAIEVIGLSHEVVRTERNNAASVDNIINLVQELHDVQIVRHLTCVNLKVASASFKTLKA